MEATVKFWVVIVIVGALNYLSRLSFIAVFARRSMPPLLARALRYVPAAMLAALVVPMILTPAPGATPEPRLVAAVLAGVVAFRTRSTLATLAAGMLALWAIELALARGVLG